MTSTTHTKSDRQVAIARSGRRKIYLTRVRRGWLVQTASLDGGQWLADSGTKRFLDEQAARAHCNTLWSTL